MENVVWQIPQIKENAIVFTAICAMTVFEVHA
jgi:hypothetical protein